MYLLNIVLIGVVVGLASCDIDCFTKESSSCGTNDINDVSSLLGNYCNTMPPYIECLYKAANKCNIFQKLIKNWLDNAKDACTNGTKLNKDLETNFECISEAAKNADCFNDISHHPDQGDEQQKENHLVCQVFEEMTICLYGQIEQDCGRTAKDSFYAIYEPMNQYFLKLCYL
ncbi:uncharacterized protein LOC129966618 [Argiope bruennichi]|uniref:uncharacterized protein LOC129966618 n=1 Tax=Argiope bruennichi TaxID=94029 RepID=UPI0024941651|nr:uncharacterized protein LOC129966618 [Argiope bruennichi]